MIDLFEQKLARLKRALGVDQDQDVALALGISKGAFSDRKRRGAFPDKEVHALANKKPELKLDAEFVVTGRYGSHVGMTYQGPLVTGNHLDPAVSRYLAEADSLADMRRRQRATAYERLVGLASTCDDEQFNLLLSLAEALSRATHHKLLYAGGAVGPSGPMPDGSAAKPPG